MAMIVMKFGGSSLATDEQVEKVASAVSEEIQRDSSSSIVICVSARGKTTNQIRAQVRDLGGSGVSEEILDFAGPAGEIISAACLAAALEQKGVQTLLGNGRDIGLLASGEFGQGRVKTVQNPKFITEALASGQTVVLAAYAGITAEGKSITLGRSGSDTFAVAVAAAIHADVCRIYTDVPGFFAVDPSVVRTAKMFKNITYWQAMELCKAGSQVLKERCIAIAAGLGVRVQILLSPSFDHEPWKNLGIDVKQGTWLWSGALLNDMEATAHDQTGLAVNAKIVAFNIVGVPNRPGVSGKIFGPLSGVMIGDVAQSLTPEGQTLANISFIVREENADQVEAVLREVDLGGAVIERRNDLACLTVIDSRMTTESGWIPRISSALGRADINIEIHPSSGDTILLVVAKQEIGKATGILAKKFDLCI